MANIKQFGEFTTPIGVRGNVFSVSSWAQVILGVMVFIVAFAMGQNLAARLGKVVPVDTTIEPIVQAQVAGPSIETYGI